MRTSTGISVKGGVQAGGLFLGRCRFHLQGWGTTDCRKFSGSQLAAEGKQGSGGCRAPPHVC